MRDRRTVLRHREEILLRIIDGLCNREWNFARLAVADADSVDLVADDDERGKRETPAALDDRRHAIDLDDALRELSGLLALDHLTLDAREFGPSAQNFSPPPRTASASAFTRPWYR